MHGIATMNYVFKLVIKGLCPHRWFLLHVSICKHLSTVRHRKEIILFFLGSSHFSPCNCTWGSGTSSCLPPGCNSWSKVLCWIFHDRVRTIFDGLLCMSLDVVLGVWTCTRICVDWESDKNLGCHSSGTIQHFWDTVPHCPRTHQVG